MLAKNGGCVTRKYENYTAFAFASQIQNPDIRLEQRVTQWYQQLGRYLWTGCHKCEILYQNYNKFGQIGSAWEWWYVFKKSSTAKFTVCIGTNCDLFRRTVLQNCRKVNICSLDYGSWVEYFKNSNIAQSKPKWCSPLADFSTNKSAPANWKKGFYTNRDPNKQEVGFIFIWSGSEFWSLFKYAKLKI